MSNLVNTQEKALASHFNPQQVELIKKTIMPGASDDELQLFGMVCQRLGLDPFSRQINAIKRGGKWGFEPTIDGFRSIAESTGKYGGSETYWCGEDGVWHDVWLKDEPPKAAKTIVYRSDAQKPFVAVARFNSYKVEYKGQLSNFWAKMPDLMIGKVSEALALRKAFPRNLSGVYCDDEMGQASQVEVVENKITKEQGIEIKRLRKSIDYSVEQLIDLCSHRFAKHPRELSYEEADFLIGELNAIGNKQLKRQLERGSIGIIEAESVENL
ncbi:phage recombination protein Bet [Crocosphaera sp.]|uniref:phage recombination protein Bet n=1 Tax=Crocosphaera sp. TaxID=2729996 RepID=UPI00260E36F4|nr:phage recombination protein Bet [Crocosphaera sp.]MDJ0579034.1 phage recombination protein Bet [Crocosphaera sp.]